VTLPVLLSLRITTALHSVFGVPEHQAGMPVTKCVCTSGLGCTTLSIATMALAAVGISG
jgi:hypothetical protein